jgi:hypothetical protein
MVANLAFAGDRQAVKDVIGIFSNLKRISRSKPRFLTF